jgi:hypothetical protein
VIVVALIKVRFVILDFMEVHTAPFQLRLALEGWGVLVGVVVAARHTPLRPLTLL